MAVSVLEIFKVGIGPSSSHTVGPMRAARMFTLALAEQGVMTSVTRVLSEMFGSLGATGKGHGTDSAVLLGLSGHEPDTVDVDQVPAILEGIRGSSSLLLQGAHRIALDEEADLMLSGLQTLAFHSNGMRFTAFDASGSTLLEKTYYSVGGGFVLSSEEAEKGASPMATVPGGTNLPFQFHSAVVLDFLGWLTRLVHQLVADGVHTREMNFEWQVQVIRFFLSSHQCTLQNMECFDMVAQDVTLTVAG